MGIYQWVSSLTGVWGPALVSFYNANALWINTIVVLYGIVLLLSWQNTEHIADALVSQVLAQAAKIPGRESRPRRKVHLSQFRLSWEDALAHGKFPLVTSQAGFVPRKRTLENVQRAIPNDFLQRRCRPKLARIGLELEK
jgi:hypothetical protein